MRAFLRYAIIVLFPIFAGCGHLTIHSGDIHRLVQVWPTNADFQGIAVMALLGDDMDSLPISEGKVINLPETDKSDFSIQFAIGNAFRRDVYLRVSTRFDETGTSPPSITCSDMSAAAKAALLADRDYPYRWLHGTDRTGVRPRGFSSSGMTWQVEGATLTISRGSSVKFRRIIDLDFYMPDEGKHYFIEYPFECTLRRS